MFEREEFGPGCRGAEMAARAADCSIIGRLGRAGASSDNRPLKLGRKSNSKEEVRGWRREKAANYTSDDRARKEAMM